MKQLKLLIAAVFLISSFAANATDIQSTDPFAAGIKGDTTYGFNDIGLASGTVVTTQYAEIASAVVGSSGVQPYFGLNGTTFDSIAVTGNDVVSMDNNPTVNAIAVLEPGTLALLGLGLAGMGMTRRKK